MSAMSSTGRRAIILSIVSQIFGCGDLGDHVGQERIGVALKVMAAC